MVHSPPIDDSLIDEVLNESLPDDVDFGPTQCAICGKQRTQDDLLNPDIPLQLPVETLRLMANPEAISVSDDDVSLRLHFCDEHWQDLLDITGEPQVVSFAEFDARFVETASATVREKLSGEESPADSRWDQDRLRLSRDWTRNPSEDRFSEDRQRVEGTLVVSAVDHFGIEYGATEWAKDRLVSELRELGHRATQLKDPWLDVELQLTEVSEPVVGTVFVVSSGDYSSTEDLSWIWRDGIERAVGDTGYYPISNLNFTDYASETKPGAQHVGFYWLEDEETWRWYPFPEEYTRSHLSEDRQYLPVNGPTGQIPSLPLEMMNSETLSPEGFEVAIQDRWETIEAERPLLERILDKLRRKLRE